PRPYRRRPPRIVLPERLPQRRPAGDDPDGHRRRHGGVPVRAQLDPRLPDPGPVSVQGGGGRPGGQAAEAPAARERRQQVGGVQRDRAPPRGLEVEDQALAAPHAYVVRAGVAVDKTGERHPVRYVGYGLDNVLDTGRPQDEPGGYSEEAR